VREGGSFSEAEATLAPSTYRDKLLGLMAIHLLLVSINRIHTLVEVSMEVVLDCLGALKQATTASGHWTMEIECWTTYK
jgi:hypothetical protein